MASSLEDLVAQGVVSEVIARLKSGKEADVYMVRYSGTVVAAKVYKDRAQRSFKNNAAYKEGRSVRNSRSQRAIDKGSKFGKDAEETEWKATEVATLYKLHGAGVRTPTPILFLDGVLLMEVIRGEDGEIAPRLIDVDLTVEQAAAGYRDMLTQLVRILSCDLIHGDLSPYNVLWGAKGPTIIDFPQAISAAHNNSSESFFIRDARNILDYFVALDPSLKARSSDAREIWRAYVRRELTPDFVPTGRSAPVEQPRPQREERQQHEQRTPHQQRGGQQHQQRPPQQQRGGQQHQQQAPQQQRGGQQRPPQQQRGGEQHQQRAPQQRGEQHQQRAPQQRGEQHQQRAPQQQRGGQQRGGQHQQRAPQQQRDGQQHQQRAPQQQRRPPANGSGPPSASQDRHPPPPRSVRPRPPEVIVMTRRTRPTE